MESQHKPLPVLSYSLAHPSSLLNTVKLAIALLHVHSANHLSFQPVSVIWVINYSRIAKFAEKQGHLFQSVLSTFSYWKLMGCFICQWFRTELYSQTIFFKLIMKNCSEITSVYIKMINYEQTLRLKGTNTILVDALPLTKGINFCWSILRYKCKCIQMSCVYRSMLCR